MNKDNIGKSFNKFIYSEGLQATVVTMILVNKVKTKYIICLITFLKT